MKLTIPVSLQAEHKELHDDLRKAIGSEGKTGQSAKAVADVLHPHFLKEEEFAMPPLGLLLLLEKTEDIDAATKREVIAMTDRLASEMPQMLIEHQSIIVAVDDLRADAIAEGKQEYAHLADRLMMHARNEEEVLYPTAILVGKYLRIGIDH